MPKTGSQMTSFCVGATSSTIIFMTCLGVRNWSFCTPINGDDDLIPDISDNCILVSNPDQLNTDGDVYGNACDPDFDQNGVVDSTDLSILKAAFRTSDANYDINGNGVVDSTDYSIAKGYLRKPPGPSCCGLR